MFLHLTCLSGAASHLKSLTSSMFLFIILPSVPSRLENVRGSGKLWVCYRKDHIIYTTGSVLDAARNLDVCRVLYLTESQKDGKMILF